MKISILVIYIMHNYCFSLSFIKSTKKYEPLRPYLPGHYEKILRQSYEYVWVNGEKPSEFPGALVVSKRVTEKMLDHIYHK